jgi:bifunctional non-homologous end joining protein LigD
MTLAPTTIQSASLYFSRGSFAKEYHVAIEPKELGFIVTFAFFRHGSNLKVGTKTPRPLPLTAAIRVFDRLIASKLAKGYHSCFPECPCHQCVGD